MSEEELIAIYERATRYGKTIFHSREDSEEFGAYVVEKVLTRPSLGNRPYLYWLYIDYLQDKTKTYRGRKHTDYEDRLAFYEPKASLDDFVYKADKEATKKLRRGDTLQSPKSIYENEFEMRRLLNLCETDEERDVLALMIKGHSVKEIAWMLKTYTNKVTEVLRRVLG